MQVIVDIPDDVAERLRMAGGDLSRRALEAFALEEYKRGQLTTAELRRLLGFGTRDALDGFLKAHDILSPMISMISRASGATWSGLGSDAVAACRRRYRAA